MPKGARKFYAKSPLSRKGAKTSRRNSAKKAKLRSKRRRQIN
ncbi:BZ3500_MvSof-1268-A1-R1_Chr6-2g08488 [Microbotryum saponariae]|uniref:BZ3500_MvSof-1268-A1-R1_Chr6-2g08488 protein n=1 Tax=Microbotryum saponariae TaxID=289078 RepID=A0A2X0MEQ6_9BASI|nr:BZ3500_MvSof-1268-A1-R1_Chr6-2g08488 [Microbotryum saponariae]SDA07765.1 BZ3501_MvSof-1269-A2-R1_Chr6-1g08202 [Microbotryum saponariae]